MDFADIYTNSDGYGDVDKLFDKLTVACCCFNEKGGLLACNLAWARLFKLENTADARKKIAKLFEKGVHKVLLQGIIQAALFEGEAHAEIPCIADDGTEIFLDITLKREAANIVTGHAFEITKYHKAQEAAVKTERDLTSRQRQIFDANPIPGLFWDEDYNLLDCNDAAVKFFEVGDKEEVIRRYNDFQPETQPCGTDSDTKARRHMDEALKTGMARYQHTYLTKDGEILPVEATYVLIHGAKHSGKRLLAAFAQDLRPVREAMARETEALRRWHMVLDTLPVGVNMLTKNGDMLDVNTTMLEQFGCKDKEEYFENWMNTLPEYQNDGTPTIEKFKATVNFAFENGIHSGSEWQMQTIHGEPVPMYISSVVVNQDASPLLITYATDLRSLRAETEKVLEERQFSHILYESSPHGVSIWDSSHKIISANRQLLNLFEAKSLEEFRDKFPALHYERQPNGMFSDEMLNLYLARAFDGETVRFEWVSKNLSGEALPLEITFVRYRRGTESFVAAYAVDLRDIKGTMERLREADERAGILIGALPIPSALMNSDYMVVECNQAAVSLLARTSEAPFDYTDSEDGEAYYCDKSCENCAMYRQSTCVVRRCLIRNWQHTLLGPKNNSEEKLLFVKQLCEKATEAGRYIQTGYMQTLAGEELFLETTFVPVNYKGEQGFAVYIRDLREAHLREVAEEESRAKTRFLARMSHEIRTPMNAVLGITEIQLQKGFHSPDTEEAFLRIYHSSNLLLSIINDILDLSKVEAGKMEIVPRKYELYSLIVDTAQLNIMHMGHKNINFKLKIDENLPRSLRGDELRIKQVMNNILSNAFKYTKRGTVTLAMRCEKTDEAGTAMLVIEINDTGQGMSKSQLDTLFELEFNRLNLHINRDIQGSGLGMTITYHLVGLMNGKITAESTPGKGSKFTVRLPQGLLGEETLGPDAAALQNVEAIRNTLKGIKKIEREEMSYGRVLVVDDVESNLFVAKGMLKPYKLSVTAVTSGYDAVDKIRNGKVYDIIFMDHMMPGMDGIEATRLIREEGYDSPIVALTANILVGQEEMFLSSGFNGFISKPIDASKLDACLIQYIKNNPLTDAPDSTTAAEELSGALTASFLRDADRINRVLAEIYVSSKWDEESLKIYTINIHAIKSALANVNQTELSETAYALEEASRAGDTERLKAETGLFLEKLAIVMQKLTPENSPTSFNNEDEDPTLLRRQLKRLAEACDAYNKKAAKKALANLSGKKWSFETRAMLDRITTELLHSDFEKAADIARGR